MQNKTCKGFTLIEITIVLVLSGIIAGIGYFALEVVNHRMHALKDKFNMVSAYTAFNSVLTRDFNRSLSVKKIKGKSIVCTFEGQAIQYTFDNEQVLRKVNNKTDTFHIAPKNVKYYFNGTTIFETKHIIDKLTFQSTLDDKEIPFVFTTHYGNNKYFHTKETNY